MTHSDAHRRAARNERTRRYRAHQRAGEKVARAPYTNAIVELLLDTGWLKVEDSEDPAAVGQAMYAALADTAAHRT